MIPRELFKKIRRIEISTNRKVNEQFGGRYHSVFKGRGMEFAEVRAYSPGDDVRTIDWNVTARMGELHTKKFVEERELVVVILADYSASEGFGTVGQLKRELAAEIGALFAFSATRNNDKVGLILFTDRVEKYVKPQKGKKHALRVIRELLITSSKGKGTDLKLGLDYLNRIMRRKAVVILISDFIGSGYEKSLKIAGRKHDLIAVKIRDPFEESVKRRALIRFEDLETGAEALVNFNARAAKEYSAGRSKGDAEISALLKACKVDEVTLKTGEDYLKPLISLFNRRARRQ
jgi:uncharacterized protein (DUF58 family)